MRIDLEHVLFSIKQIHEADNELVEGKKCFIEAFSLLNQYGRKEKLCTLVICNIGLISIYQLSYKDGIKIFDLVAKVLQSIR